ncbi:ATP-binding protein [Flavobacterium sp. CYK-55]|uniref:ATP-binding protein n=1 Tax=Flavobacterium sp. CYK-55 TaxID=2835529 RepID=UPI001BCBFC28|nr:AAA family ATPase [Flavobacterium sp. CYK-55]MBS7787975.1 ATP-binding protein [Flavobacterium sp. CYK-55]
MAKIFFFVKTKYKADKIKRWRLTAVMLYHLVQDLIDHGVNPQKIIFITIENPIYNNILLEQLFSYAKEATGLKDRDGWYIIFDEIQYYKNWEVDLKSLVDGYRNDKFIVSGSAAAALKFASNESGAGRFTDFLLPPLTFHEYVSMKKLDHIIKPTEITWRDEKIVFYTSINIVELNRHFIKYINFGGYPEVIFSEKIQENPGRYISQDIVDKVLLRDLPSLYGISDTRELNSLFTTIAYNTGEEFSLETLSRESQVNKNTLKKYIEYLEAAFLIKKVQRIDQAGKQFKRDHFFKIYLTNPSLRSALFSPITPDDDVMGRMVETAIFAQWIHRDWFNFWYSRWNGGEVDMVGLNDKLKPNWALEIKWSNRYFNSPLELKSLLKFCSENNIDHPIVTTIDKEGSQLCRDLTLQYFPAAAYAYTVGKKTLEMKKNR